MAVSASRSFATAEKYVSSSSLYIKRSPGSFLVGPYELTETLGRGNFGKVRLARHLGSGLEFAVKVVDKRVLQEDLPSNLDIRREMSILRALSHPNIVHLHEVMVSKVRVYLVMDLARGGDFFKMISANGRLDEHLARRYFRQLVDAVDYCHQRGIYHRDLKPENILLTEDGNLKVTDFGFSAMKDHGQHLLKTNCGSPHYCAPEVWNGSQVGYDGAKSDAFSIGVILFVLLAGGQPFYDENEERLLQKVNRCRVNYPSWLSADAKDLLSKLLVRDPRKRWSLPMVKRHIWYTTGSASYCENMKAVLCPQITLLEDELPLPAGSAVSGTGYSDSIDLSVPNMAAAIY